MIEEFQNFMKKWNVNDDTLSSNEKTKADSTTVGSSSSDGVTLFGRRKESLMMMMMDAVTREKRGRLEYLQLLLLV